MGENSSVKTVDRLVMVLDCFTAYHPAWSLAELSAELGLPKSTLHRFLVGLEQHGILRRDVDDRRWRLGYRLFNWGNLAVESTGLRDLARPIMRDLSERSGETAILTVYDQGEVVCIEKVETHHPVRLALRVGDRRPPHAGASSTVLMAHLPEGEVAEIIAARGLPRLCSNTVTTGDALLRHLSAIRQLGYAVSVEETDPGAWGIATPVRDHSGRVVAAIGVAGPTSRFSDDVARRYVELCGLAADELSSRLGAYHQ
jgi:DNA-binding IclR family transcriptional regulator